ncbi:aminomethyl-transferring glycine dehydrogenase [Candidatus Synechococcus calcipolaris G9]|uniref:Glycine dehydrogenase (decarboxylating) n=1 Tax=Candidatus Synechococcus calcipolaris G9 TaxID=1497997 RepID=A0ABT6EUB1_9SYNE|nr:aminomethyl-transferring glycine dehydrogenase [Candidatus Synechococcus calcipolaris]MDG2989471.1 aminomethyl-transferring glycine dehydrogenase [Candidatus Synechococcus calcipolaris G9]
MNGSHPSHTLAHFSDRHIGPNAQDIAEMLEALGATDLETFTDQVIPAAIRSADSLALSTAKSETEALETLRAIASKNQVWRSFIGMGYANSITPAVIQRNILENPGWYTQYTPYQAEIAQGRLEALLNFQTLVCELTGLDIANASLLDEATAAAEAMTMSLNLCKNSQANCFLVAANCHPQTLGVLRTRANPLGIDIQVIDPEDPPTESPLVFGLLLQYPATDGALIDHRHLIEWAHQQGLLVTMATDLLALTLLAPPGELGADIAVGSSQRLGVPLGYGGPHAAFVATRAAYKRNLPGRLVGVSKDAMGQRALRLALQTREQHIRREKATSNICTAQVLLAVMASMYAVYHGPHGLRAIAQGVYDLTNQLAQGLEQLGYSLKHDHFFDTLWVSLGTLPLDILKERAAIAQINLRYGDGTWVGISLDETTTETDIRDLLGLFTPIEQRESQDPLNCHPLTMTASGNGTVPKRIPPTLTRTSPYLNQPVFNTYHSEHGLLRYIHRLQAKDLSLTTSMIPLGSCTMKLNATAEMIPVSWPEFSQIHPFAPLDQAQGYQTLFHSLEGMLAEITGFAGVSLQPNAGSQGEYAGLLVIRRYHQERGDRQRSLCLIPTSAHGTNPASAVMAGMEVVTVNCDAQGNIDQTDLKQKAEAAGDRLAALMITYPSTHGVFEAGIREICQIIHDQGGQVYMDGANMNAQVGLCRPGEFGADVCHLNLHKTFCIPHGGGGPGVGPIGVKAHLVPFLPSHPLEDHRTSIGPVTAAPWGSASILPISWMYITMMGGAGLRLATQVAILNANYIAQRLQPYYPVLYKDHQGLVAHECILDLRPLKKTAGIEVEDVAKRLMDYGFHAPTISWPVAGTMMIEPTESETKAELDRFCEAMISIRAEIAAIENGTSDRRDNPLKQAPHPALAVTADHWPHSYPRSIAAYPSQSTQDFKFWPAVARIDNAHGDRNLVCTCLPVEAYSEQSTT